MDNFNEIQTRNELADFIGVPRKTLSYILYVKKVDTLYNTFEIPKKDGGVRQISAPSVDLKHIQNKLAAALWKHQKKLWALNKTSPKISHAFEENRSIITNAKIHRNKKYILNVDLKNFFDSFHFGRVRGFFMINSGFKVTTEVATVIAQLTCYNGALPQGAPSSPIITNLICQILDFKLLQLAKKYRLDYTRYADDLTFSTNNNAFYDKKDEFYEQLSKEIKKAGFIINTEKTSLQLKSSRQVVTGLTVNKKINVFRSFYKQTRAMAHQLYISGSFESNGKPGTINELEGRFSFVNQLERYNNKLDNKQHDFRNLSSRERQYQRFLFYRYFFANERPLIITEGKTDITYLKAALKNLSGLYPDLLLAINNDNANFEISFLKRTHRLKYFFGLDLDGADTMKNIFELYYKNKVFPKRLEKACKDRPNQPVILIFDNELKNKNKPISKFCTSPRVSQEQKRILENNYYINIVDNLYVLTFPLVKNLNECEIEDLFDDETLAHKINGKSFSRESKPDSNLYYSKHIFSKYISANYKSIDFSQFKPLLDSINDIIRTHHTNT